MLRQILAVTLTAGLLAACGGPVGAPAPLQAPDALVDASGRKLPSYTNPVYVPDFPDPAVMRSSDGYFYAYATQTRLNGRMDNVSTTRSKDLVHWERLPDAMPKKPTWASETQDIWAPHVVERDGLFTMYFSSDTNQRNGLTIGVATSRSAAGPFVATSKPIARGPGFENIDPMPFDDPATGKRWLFWGSGFKPIRARELREDGLAFAPGSETIDVLSQRDQPLERLIEGAWVIQRDGYYYLFYSGDNCCTDVPGVGEPTYAVMVARSRSVTGPYERMPGGPNGDAKPILHRNDRWLAPGHNAVIQDAAGRDWIVYHAIDAEQRFAPGTKDLRRGLLIDPIVWRGGWPRIVNDSPSIGPKAAPRVK